MMSLSNRITYSPEGNSAGPEVENPEPALVSETKEAVAEETEYEPKFYLPNFQTHPEEFGFETPDEFDAKYLDQTDPGTIQKLKDNNLWYDHLNAKSTIRIRYENGIPFYQTKTRAEGPSYPTETQKIQLDLDQALQLSELVNNSEKTRYYKDFELEIPGFGPVKLTAELDIRTNDSGALCVTLEVESDTEAHINYMRQHTERLKQAIEFPDTMEMIDVTFVKGFSEQDIARKGFPKHPNQLRYSNAHDGLNGLKMEVQRNIDVLKPGETYVIANSGGSASGKSRSSEGLIKDFLGAEAPTDIDARKTYDTEDVQFIIIGMDEYYWAMNQLKEVYKNQGKELSFDEPDALKMDKIQQILTQAKASPNAVLEIPIHNYDAENESERTFRTVSLNPNKKQVIILDGLFAGSDLFKKGIHDENPAVRHGRTHRGDLIDLRVFVNADSHTRFFRRVLRDPSRLNTPRENVADFFLSKVAQKHDNHIEPQKRTADIVINNHLTAGEIESLTAQSQQLKFKVEKHEFEGLKTLIESAEIQGNHEGRFTETDSYFEISDENEPGQVVRIRQQNDQYAYSFKGKLKDGTEATLQTPLSSDTNGVQIVTDFTQVYGKTSGQVKKTFERYRTPKSASTISLHEVTIGNGEAKYFIEIKSDHENAAEMVRQQASILFPEKTPTDKSYYQMLKAPKA